MEKLFKFTLLLSLISFALSLHFDLSKENKKCYIEELFENSVAVIKYKLWSSPQGVDKCKFQF